MNQHQPTARQIQIEELGIALREHQAYKECIQFDGDTCSACEEIERDLYNLRYADYVARRAALYARTPNCAPVNEQDLINAHDYAAYVQDVPPPDGYVQMGEVESQYQCPRCEDTGYTAFYWVDGGVCFDCGGRMKYAKADAKAKADAVAARQSDANPDDIYPDYQ